ncbi:MAG: class I SAM-dependent methyltransferase [Chitinispirillales bacterium]|jgi:predicted O-methyltransferase YrrM|nr:class I SAM-dependent methyltransferase [Chitinispirillales bacterium]
MCYISEISRKYGVKNNVSEVVMGLFRRLVKNALPHYFVKKYQEHSGGGPFEPGGYYSPIPSLEEIKGHNFNIPLPELLPGIDLNANEQLNLLDSFETFYKELPFTDEKSDGLRYYYNNGCYSYSDAILLYCMMRYLKPKKIIEAGSGFSSSVMLDTNEKFMGNSINCKFIEPYPARLESLLKNNDREYVTIHQKRLQEVSIDVFTELNENDILFIDSTHVAKFNSDVNYIFHEILPILAHGVHIHFHDVFYPFEYPREWLLEGRAWNEQYMLRAFLEYNNNFKIVLFNTYLESMYESKIKSRFPLLYKNTGGSIWLKKI